MSEVSGVTPSIGDVERAVAALQAQRGTLGDAAVDAAVAALRAQVGDRSTGRDGERRSVVTVLFADLEGFTSMSAALDAEDVREIVARCFASWRAIIETQGGIVEKYIGDAVMAVFGLHRTDEDDAVRAVRAGRAMVDATAEIAAEVERTHGVGLHVRVGIDTGDVVVSTLDDRSGQGFVAVGPAVNRASRLQASAPRDMVLLSERTRRHLRGRFGLDPRSGLQLKGIDEPVDAYVALAERPTGFDLDTATAPAVTATVGREIELLALQDHVADVVEESRWRIVTVTGEAGIGKSRLLRDLDAWLSEQPESYWWLRGRAAATTRTRPHAMLRDLVSTRFGIRGVDVPATVLDKCVDGLRVAFGETGELTDDARTLSRWLGFETIEAGPPMDPQTLSARASDVLARYLARLSERAPVVMLLEDLHWADDASLAWLDSADAVLHERPVLVVATARPELRQEHPHWGEGLSHHASMSLGPLARRHGRSLLLALLERAGLADGVPQPMVESLVEQSEGNPYYLEELVAWLADGGRLDRDRVEAAAGQPLPTTLQGLLQARLDALPAAQRSVLERAAVVGRVFWQEVVERLGDGDGVDVAATLEQLREGGLVLQRAASTFEGSRELLFRHALLRDVAYERQLRARRRDRHERVARWLREVTERSGRADEVAALVAEHLDQAGHPDAPDWYLRAGTRAAAVYAIEEADRLLGRGLELDPAPAVRVVLLLEHEDVADRRGDRDRQLADLDDAAALLDEAADDRLALRHAQARARFGLTTSGYAEGISWAHRAADLALRLDATDERAHAHLWAGKCMVWASDPRARVELEQALALAEEGGVSRVRAEAWRYLAMLAANTGDLGRAMELSERSRALFAEVGDLEGEGAALTQLSTTSYHLGRLRDARRYLERARPVFARAGRHAGEVLVLGNLATITAGQGELAQALIWAREGLVGNRRLHDLEGEATNLVVLAEIELQLGRWADATAHAREGELLAQSVPETNAVRATSLAVQAHGWSSRGEHERALDAARRAVGFAGHASPQDAAFARLALGYVTMAAGDPGTALGALTDAAREYDALGVRGYATEAMTARAEALRQLGRTTEAIAVVDEVIDVVEETELEGAQPEYAWLWCWQVLRDAGDERAGPFRDRAVARLRERAGRIGDDAVAQEYLDRPVARTLLGG